MGSQMSTGRKCSSPARPCLRTTARSLRSLARRSAGNDSTRSSQPRDRPSELRRAANVGMSESCPLGRARPCGVRRLPRRHGHHPEGAAHGAPVVAIPFGRDQPEVARRVEVARAGVRLPAHKLTPTPSPNRRPRRDQPPTGSAAHRRRVRGGGRTRRRGRRTRDTHSDTRAHVTTRRAQIRRRRVAVRRVGGDVVAYGPRASQTGRRPSGRGLESVLRRRADR